MPDFINILAIETSCDETAVSVMQFQDLYRHKILSEEISSQVKTHSAYGGVVPEIASREHLKAITPFTEMALKKSSLTISQIDLIAATYGPGLKGCLLVGHNFAKGLSMASGIPFIGVNHIEGHVFSTFLKHKNIKFPFISLTVSGAHTELHIVHDFGKYELFSKTIDDAAGEAFDKSANLLGFDYPGGAMLSEFSAGGEDSAFALPKVMKDRREFSFSGLKTAISLLVKKNTNPDGVIAEKVKRQLCYTIQEAVVDTIMSKIKLVLSETGIGQISVAGGVSANSCLRQKLSSVKSVEVFFPEKIHATDNASMIALAGGVRYLKGEITPLGQDVIARDPIHLRQ